MRTERPDHPATIVITRGDPAASSDPEPLAAVTQLYADAVARAGGEPIVLLASADARTRADAFARMAGVLLSGGADIDPQLYGEPMAGSEDVQPTRDALERAAWEAAKARGLPVLGICRGLQAINVFSGGTLLQDVTGHAGPGWRQGPPLLHRMRVVGETQLARILRPTNPLGFVVQINSSHHQAVRAEDLAPGLAASGWSPSPAGELVEALEGRDPTRFVLGVQCHPERTESSPLEFERLFRFFVDAAWHTTRGIAKAS